MQQNKAYWRLVAVAAGVVSAFVASACVITTDDTLGSAGAAGASTAGAGHSGAHSAGAGTAGAATAGAGTGTAGAGTTAGTGGAPPVSFQCDPVGNGGAQGTPNDCSLLDATDKCEQCIQISCCVEYEACYATNPGNQCGWGGPAGKEGGEEACVQLCIQDGVKLSGTDPDAELVGTCGANCATSLSNGATKECGSVIGTQTNELIGCQMEHCVKECFTGEP